MASKILAPVEKLDDSPRRLAIVFDGRRWYVRRIRVIEHDLDRDEMIYRCDLPISGPHTTLAKAIADSEKETGRSLRPPRPREGTHRRKRCQVT